MRTELLCVYVLRVASGPRLKLASCKSAFFFFFFFLIHISLILSMGTVTLQ